MHKRKIKDALRTEDETAIPKDELKFRTCAINVKKGLALNSEDSAAFVWFLAQVVGLLANAGFGRHLEMEGVVIFKTRKTAHQDAINAVERAISNLKRGRTGFAEECVFFG